MLYVAAWYVSGNLTAIHRTDGTRSLKIVRVWRTRAAAEKILREYWEKGHPSNIAELQVMDAVRFAIENRFDRPMEFRYGNNRLAHGPKRKERT